MTKRLIAVLTILLLTILVVAAVVVSRDAPPATAQGPTGDLFVGAADGLYVSDDNGATFWQTYESSGPITAMDIFGGYLYIGDDNSIVRSSDGYSFTGAYTDGDTGWRVVSLEVCGSELWAAGNDGVIYSSSDGTTWGTEYDTSGGGIYDMEFDTDGNGAIGGELGRIYPVTGCVVGTPVTVYDTDVLSIGLDHDEAGNVVVYAGGEGGDGNVWDIDGNIVFTPSVSSGIQLPDEFVLEWAPVLGDRLSYPYGLGDGTLETWRSDGNGIAPLSQAQNIDTTDFSRIIEVVYDDYNGDWYAIARDFGDASGAVYVGDLTGFDKTWSDVPPYSILVGSLGGAPVASPTSPGDAHASTPTPTPTATRTPTPAVRLLFESMDSTPTRMPILQLGFANGPAATPVAIPPTNTPTPTATPTPAMCIVPTPPPIVVGTVAPSQASGGSSIPVSDTFICSDLPFRNFGNRSTLSLNSGCSVLSKYTVSAILPADAVVHGAQLHLFVLAQPSTELGDTVFFVNSLKPGAGNATWTELGATWKDRNPSSAWSVSGARGAGSDYVPTPIGYMTIDGAYVGWVAIDLQPSVVQAWIDNPASNYGFVVWSDTTSHDLRLSSSEWVDAGFRPYLSVDYTVPG